MSFDPLVDRLDLEHADLQINAAWVVLPLTVGLFLTALFAIEAAGLSIRRAAPCRRREVALLVGIVYAIRRASLHLGNGGARCPCWRRSCSGVAGPAGRRMLLGSLMFLLISGVAPLIAAAQNTVDGTGNFILRPLRHSSSGPA